MPISVAPSDHGFDVIVHVPLFEPDSTMTLFQHLPMPMPIDDGVFLTVDSPYDTIAIFKDNEKYRLTTITDIAEDCSRLGEFYACSRDNNALVAPIHTGVHESDDPALCLWALLWGRGDVTGKTCRRSLINPGTAVVQISARRFLTYGKTNGHLQCHPPKNIVTPFSTKAVSYTHLTLPTNREV